MKERLMTLAEQMINKNMRERPALKEIMLFFCKKNDKNDRIKSTLSLDEGITRGSTATSGFRIKQANSLEEGLNGGIEAATFSKPSPKQKQQTHLKALEICNSLSTKNLKTECDQYSE
jgi:hypothetical protein